MGVPAEWVSPNLGMTLVSPLRYLAQGLFRFYSIVIQPLNSATGREVLPLLICCREF
jgi:hypothetical protein